MKICFVCWPAYPVFDSSSTEGIGGAEVRAYRFATGLAKLERHDVHFVVATNQKRPSEKIDGVTVHHFVPDGVRSKDLPDGFRKLQQLSVLTASRFVGSLRKRVAPLRVPQPTPQKTYFDIQADVYCCVGVNNYAADVIASAQLAGKKTVLFSTCDLDFSDLYYRGSQERGVYGENGHLCHYSITQCDHVIVQKPSQRERLNERFGRRSSIIRNPIDVLETERALTACDTKSFALWVGRIDPLKDPHACIEFARRCPQIPITMILNNENCEVFQEIKRTLPENITLIDQVPFREISRYYQEAKVLLNTSRVEGFPNAFLQAAKYGTPILSLRVDPEEMLSKHGCGVNTSGDIDAMAKVLREWFENELSYRNYTDAGPKYIATYHEAESRVRELESLLKHATSSPWGRNQSGRQAA